MAASYVKAADVAARLGMHWKWIGREMERRGVRPAIGRDVCLSAFYRVDDVKREVDGVRQRAAGM